MVRVSGFSLTWETLLLEPGSQELDKKKLQVVTEADQWRSSVREPVKRLLVNRFAGEQVCW